METLLGFGSVFVGLLGGIGAGLGLGELVRGRPRRYWALNVAALAVCMAVNFVGLVLGWPLLAYGALGAMGGVLTGLKYGYSESIGVWRTVDRLTGVEPIHPPEEPQTPDGPTAE